MNSDRYIWVLDWERFSQIRFPDLTWLEVAMIFAGLGALSLFMLAVVRLDLRARRRGKRARQLAQAERWLHLAQLSPLELEALDELAQSARPLGRAQFLSDPVRFETQVHEAYAAGSGLELGFSTRLRDVLQYTTDNLRAVIVSTRQLQPGNAFRVSVWGAELPRHYYGQVTAVEQDSFTLAIHEEGVKAALGNNSETDVFLLRGHGYEYRFACRPTRRQRGARLLTLHHALIDVEQGPRAMRLPLLLDITYQVQAVASDAVAELDPALAPSPPEQGLLFDLSEGGAALAVKGAIEPGRFLQLGLPIRRGRFTLTLTGRVLESRLLSGNNWLVRCELRGLDKDQRNTLRQILRHEQRRRLRSLAPIRRQTRAKARQSR